MIPEWTPEDTNYMIKTDFNSFGSYLGWSIDNSRYISSGNERNVQFFSSYDENLPECSSFIENPQNLYLVNWIINQREANWDRNTVQEAIWKLLNPSGTLSNSFDPSLPNYFVHNVQLRENIISLAYQNGEDYEPRCGDKVLILAFGPQTDPCSVTYDIVGFELPVECNIQTSTKNAWAFPYSNGSPTQQLSQRFSWLGWARYVKYVK